MIFVNNLFIFFHIYILAGKSVRDNDTLSTLNVNKTGKIYFKDLGPQIGWSTVIIEFLMILLFQEKKIFYFNRFLWLNMLAL